MINGFEITENIYQSRRTEVFRAISKKRGKPVVLKVRRELAGREFETNLRHEYEIEKKLECERSVKPLHFRQKPRESILVFQDEKMNSLESIAPKEGFHLSRFFALAIEITCAVEEIHLKNVIHKDLNPSNILSNNEFDSVKLIDFELATRISEEIVGIEAPNVLEGTLTYMSPEQTGRTNRSIDYRSDLYSMGVTFYKLLTGQLPFPNTDAMELVHCHIAKKPVPVFKVNTNVPLVVSDIVMKLLEKNAEDRYQSAFGVKMDLEKCRHQFAKNDRVKFFHIARNDFSGKLNIPQKLYGRAEEINTLLAAFDRISGGAAEMMLVAGYSGVGKTALVHEVHKPMTERRGCFAAGKFDQYQKNIPYYAITQAFNEFCRYLLMENEETLSNRKRKILEAVGNNGQIIIDVIPDLELVIGKQPSVPHVGPSEAQNRFSMFFLNFVKSICDKTHPFILFIDDLQWVDSASLGLIKKFMLDDEMKHLLIIGAYRDNEVDDSHPFIMTVNELIKKNITINRIELGNLHQTDIQNLLHDCLKNDAARIQPLTDLIYQKTRGNAFFTHRFLHTLHEQALLRFDFDHYKWLWNAEQISAQNFTDNVVDLLADKIARLPEKTTSVLKLAACIGNHFDLSMLAVIYERDKKETLSILWEAIIEGLIQPLDKNYRDFETPKKTQFMFLHDRVQQAAYALIDDERKQTVHLKIGRLLLLNTPADELEEKIFDIAGHFNHSIDLLEDKNERHKIAQLNLMAGQKAKMATAYGAAVNYLKVGQKCLIEKCWDKEYELTLHMYTEAAEAAYLNGNFDEMEQLAQEVLQHAQTLPDEAKLFETRILAYIAQHLERKAIHIALSFLKRLGVHLPEKPTDEDLGLVLQKIDVLLAGKTIQSLVDLPVMTDKHKTLALRIMAAVAPPAFFVEPKLMILLSLKHVEIILKNGNSAESSFSFACYAFILCSIVGDIDSGYQFGQLSLNLLERMGAKRYTVSTILVFNELVMPWKRHVRETLQPLLKNYQTGLETGDLEFAAYSLYVYPYYSYFIGKPLFALEKEMETYSHAMARLNQEAALDWYNLYWQVVLNLIGRSDSPCRLIGKAYDEDIQLKRYQQSKDRLAMYYLHLNKCILHYLFYEYALAVENAEIAEQYIDGATSMFAVPVFYFYDSLIRLSADMACPDEKKTSVLDRVSANQEKMKTWAHHAPMNYEHKFTLVEAEKARFTGDHEEARMYYRKAIKYANANEYIQEEALANELFARFLLKRGEDDFSELTMKKAYHCYSIWGSTIKLNHLEKHYPELLNASVTRLTAEKGMAATSHETSTSSLAAVDIVTVTKASQAIFQEMNLEKLLEKIVNIIIKNAGAEKGYILLIKNEELFIEAMVNLSTNDKRILKSIKMDDNNDLSKAIVNYVRRTGKTVIFSNENNKDQFINDPYIKTRHPKSILCVPMRYMNKATGILYLENNITFNAFTSKRIEILNIVLSQAAIAIENALAFKNLNAERDYSSNIIQNAPSLICGIDSNGTTTFINPIIESITGYREDELIGKNWWRLLYPDEEFEQVNQLFQCFPSGEVVDYEMTLTCKNGDRRNVVWNSFAKRGADNTILEIIGFGNDITDRKRAEKALSESEENYRLLVETMNEGLAVQENNVLTFVNKRFCEMTGYTREELIGKKISTFFGQENQNIIQEQTTLRAKGIAEPYEIAFRRKDGKTIHSIISPNPMSFDGMIFRGRSATFIDITERKRTEVELRQLRNYLSNIIDSMPSVLVGVDKNGRVIQWNKTAEKNTGVDACTAYGKYLSDVFPHMAGEVKKITESIRTREIQKEQKKPRLSESGTLYEDVTIYPLVSNGVEGAVIRIDNVTEQVRMEEMMIQSEKMLSVGGLAAGMAHEINNPLASMIQTASVMSNRLGKETVIPANVKAAEEVGTTMESIREFMELRGIFRMITAINESGLRVASIVDNMLSFARKSDAGKSFHLLSELLDKTLVLAATDYDLKKQYDFKLIKIKKEYTDFLPTVPCEPGKIQQVLLNILRNGAQAMQEAGIDNPQIFIRTKYEKNKNMACIEIEDNGPGMDEQTRKRLFEPFFTTKPAGMGTGLGLSVSYFIITEDHHGEMTVESKPGEGAKFIINLPLQGRSD